MSTIKELPEYLKIIQDIQPILLESIQTPLGFFMTFGIAFWLILTRDYNNIFHLFERKSNKKIERLEKYISTADLADEASLRIAKEQRDSYYFNISTDGINVERELRTELIAFYDSSSSAINWRVIRRAIRFLDLSKEGKLIVKEKNRHDTIAFYYNKLIAVMLMLSAIGLFLTRTLFIDMAPIDVIKMISSVSLCIFLSIFMLTQNFPRRDADKIEKELKNINDNCE